jgi:hypothetical protein
VLHRRFANDISPCDAMKKLIRGTILFVVTLPVTLAIVIAFVLVLPVIACASAILRIVDWCLEAFPICESENEKV